MKKPTSFEAALKELEEIVLKLESDELPLEESISLFEKGTQLSKVCSEKLEGAQKKIDQLIQEMNQTTEKNI